MQQRGIASQGLASRRPGDADMYPRKGIDSMKASSSGRQDPLPLLLLVTGVALVTVVSNAPLWAGSLLELAGRPAGVSLAVALLTFAIGLSAARLVVTRRALDNRERMVAIPADSFDPSDESVIRFAAGLSRSRRALRGLLDSPASAVRLALDADPAGRLRYAIEVPAHAKGALRAALASYDGVELRPADPPPTDDADEVDEVDEVEVARAELVLARASSDPLRAAGLDPDPLAGFARALASLDVSGGDVRIHDRFLLASDGLTRLVEDKELAALLSSAAPGEAADTLIDTVLARGAPDNVSVIITQALELRT